MGFGTRLNFAFIAVIAIMVLGGAGYALVADYLQARSAAEHRVQESAKILFADFDQISSINRNLAFSLLSDPAFSTAYQNHDRDAVAGAVNSFISRTAFNGFIVVLDKDGTVFYSSETPAKSGFSVRARNYCIDFIAVEHNAFWRGPSALSAAGTIAITAVVPTPGNGGMVAVCTPLDNQFIVGTAVKLSLQHNPLPNMGLAVVSAEDGRVVCATTNLAKNNDGLLAKITHDGFKAAPRDTADTGEHFWKSCLLAQTKNNIIGTILIAAEKENIWSNLPGIFGQIILVGAVALAAAVILSSLIEAKITSSMQFLAQRCRDLAAQKPNLPSLEQLSDEWLELGELIDTAASGLRSTIASLREQLSRKGKEPDDQGAGSQTPKELDQLNRRLSAQSKQIAEVTRQINYANQQAVSLQHKLDTILQVASEAFLILDPYGSTISANPVFLSWIGATEAEIAGTHCFELVRKPGDPPGNNKSAQAFSRHSGEPQDLINEFYPEGTVYHRRQDKAMQVLSHLQPVVDGTQIQGWIMVLRDKALRAENAQLRSEIASMLTESIRKPLAEVEPSWRSVVSGNPDLPSAAERQLAEMHKQYEHVLGMVDSLIMIHGGSLPPPVERREQVIITRLVAEVLEEITPLAKKRKLALDYKTVAGLPSLRTDRETLSQILMEILHRMIAITEPGGRVRVETQARKHEMRFSVSSSGPALPREEIVDMFAGFIQDKHAEDTYNTRLSMYLARNNVERLGGKIRAESEEGNGTLIYFVLPSG